MKKIRVSIMVTTTLLAGYIVVPTASAQYLEGQEIQETEGLEYHTLIVDDGENQTISEQESVEAQKFIQINGVISKITKEMSGKFYATVEGEDPFGFYFDEQTVILNNLGEVVPLKEGLEFTAFIDSNKPMILIYPPKYSPEVIIVHSEKEGTVQLDQFDENFLNKKKDLVINVNDKTEIINLSGNRISASDIIDKQVLIFYEYVLESFPMQAGPSKVIVLEPSNEDLAKKIVEIDHYLVNGVKMIPLRLIAEQLGYKVEYTGKGSIVFKGSVSYTITIGNKMYGYNKSLRSFKGVPSLLEYGKTYVPEEFLELLLGES